MNTYVFDYRGGEMSITVDAETEEEARTKFNKVISRKAPNFKSEHLPDGVHGIVFLYTTHKDLWHLVDIQNVEEPDTSHDGMSIAERVDHLMEDGDHQRELWGHLE